MAGTTDATTIPDSTTLYFGPWYGRSPFFEATLRAPSGPLRIDLP